MDVKWEISGIEDLDAKLAELNDRLKRKLLRQALQNAAGPVLDAVKQGARRAAGGPTYPKVKPATGDSGLRGPGHAADHIFLKVSVSREGTATAKIGPDPQHWYLSFQEFSTPGAPGKPFLRPALDSRKEQAVNAVISVLREGLDLGSN